MAAIVAFVDSIFCYLIYSYKRPLNKRRSHFLSINKERQAKKSAGVAGAFSEQASCAMPAVFYF
ncbi:hypothetical protein [Polaromonas hydrogenivorans]|uniref:Uncharacterized protein n=1 Tax=Polaromonas hydrogenivorans TaxID=335476 RepID=A0AAU7LS49_9BURK